MRARSFNTTQRNLDESIRAAESVATQLHVARSVEVRLQAGPDGDFDGYFETLAELEGAILFLRNNRGYRSCEAALQRADALLTSAMTRLVREFREGLADDRLAPDAAALHALLSETSPIPPTSLPLPALPSNSPLRAIAAKLLSVEISGQCTIAYTDVRKGRVLATLRELGIARMGQEEIHRMLWEIAETEMNRWTRQMRIAVTVLLPGERSLCDQVFGDLDLDRSAVFCAVAAELMGTLLSFGDTVAKGRVSPEKLFALLDMYQTLRDLEPDVEGTFSDEACATIRVAIHNLRARLAAAARESFTAFEAAVAKDGSVETVGDGNVSALTKYVIHYVSHMMGYQAVLIELLPEGDPEAPDSQLAVAVNRILDVLRENLNGKKNACNDPALAELFMMNNLHYVVSNVNRSDVRDLLGSKWVPRQRRIVQQHAIAYQRKSWNRVTSLLTSEGLQTGGPQGTVDVKAVKERFKALNAAIEDLRVTQSQWAIPDLDGIRADVRLRVAEILLPAYRSFLGRFGARLEAGKHPGKYIKYTPEGLESMLEDLFEGAKREP